jgi:ribosomal protein S3
VSEILVRIKRAVLAGHYAFSEKARVEMEVDGITELDVAESILNAVAIFKRLRSRSPFRTARVEHLYVIHSTNLEGLMIYTKGKLVTHDGEDHFYFLVSSKRAA